MSNGSGSRTDRRAMRVRGLRPRLYCARSEGAARLERYQRKAARRGSKSNSWTPTKCAANFRSGRTPAARHGRGATARPIRGLRRPRSPARPARLGPRSFPTRGSRDRCRGRALSRCYRPRPRGRGAFVLNAAGAWGNEIAENFGETTPMFPAAPPNFVTEPLPHFIQPALQAVDGSVILRQVERGNVIGLLSARPGRPRTQPRSGTAREGSARPRQCGTRGADAEERARDPGVVRDRRLPARHAAGDGLEPHDEEPAACLRLLRSRFPAQSRGRLHARRNDRRGTARIPIDAFAIDRFAGEFQPDQERLTGEFDAALASAAMGSPQQERTFMTRHLTRLAQSASITACRSAS